MFRLLPRYFKFVGKNVAGYDRTETPLRRLVELGIDVQCTPMIWALVSKNLFTPENTLIVYTPAVPKTM